MTTLTTNLDKLTGSLPLYSQYSGQLHAQPAYVEISPDGSISYEYNAEIGNAVPARVWHGVSRRVAIPNDLTARGYAELHAEIADRLQVLVDGMGERWDGSNHVGTLSDEAAEALESLHCDSRNGMWSDLDRDDEAILGLSE